LEAIWLYRVMLASLNSKGELLRRKFRKGKLLLETLWIHICANYKVLVFSKEKRG